MRSSRDQEIGIGVEDKTWRLRLKGEAKRDPGRTTQKPAVLCIGPAGENQTCHACLIHDAGNGAGQGGFGAVWGSKNLKAISVLGTGSIRVADPKALIQARVVTKEKYVSNWDRPDFRSWTRLESLTEADHPGFTSHAGPKAPVLPRMHQWVQDTL